MPPVGFEPTTPVGEQPQTYALDRAATGTGYSYVCFTDMLVLKGAEFLLNHINKSP